jgi:hypothetical protein
MISWNLLQFWNFKSIGSGPLVKNKPKNIVVGFDQKMIKSSFQVVGATQLCVICESLPLF